MDILQSILFQKHYLIFLFNNNIYNLLNLNDKCVIAIQVHVFYEDLIFELINKTNNIPIKFDLFISTISLIKKKRIEEYAKKIQTQITMK